MNLGLTQKAKTQLKELVRSTLLHQFEFLKNVEIIFDELENISIDITNKKNYVHKFNLSSQLLVINMIKQKQQKQDNINEWYPIVSGVDILVQYLLHRISETNILDKNYNPEEVK